MRKISFTLPGGEELALHQSADGTWCCPVCGSTELHDQPYYPEGGASFEMCSVCKFEFGFDDDPGATRSASCGIQNNWRRWRRELLEGAASDKVRYDMLVDQLKNIEASPA
jgi:rubredoxin